MDDSRDDDGLLGVYDRMRWRGIVCVSRLEPVIADLPRHPGAVRLGRLLVTAEGTVESPPERVLVAELALLDPPLEWQVWIAPDLRVDALWRDVGLVVEYNGAATHDDDRDRASDRVRHARIRAMGYEVVVVDRHDLRNPDALRDRLLAARRARALDLEAHREVHEVRHRD